MMKRSDFMPKTHAKAVFCLAEKDIEILQAVEKPNPRSRNGPAMKLYCRKQLEAVAHRKWGGPEGLAAEQRRREERRAVRASVSPTASAAAADSTTPAATRQPASPTGSCQPAPSSVSLLPSLAWLGLPPLVSERIRQVVPLSLFRWVVAAAATAAAAAPCVLAQDEQVGPAPQPTSLQAVAAPRAAAGKAADGDRRAGGLEAGSSEQAVELAAVGSTAIGLAAASRAPRGPGPPKGRDTERSLEGLKRFWGASEVLKGLGTGPPAVEAATGGESRECDTEVEAKAEVVDLVETSDADEHESTAGDSCWVRRCDQALGSAATEASAGATTGRGTTVALGKRRREPTIAASTQGAPAAQLPAPTSFTAAATAAAADADGDEPIFILSSSDEDEMLDDHSEELGKQAGLCMQGHQHEPDEKDEQDEDSAGAADGDHEVREEANPEQAVRRHWAGVCRAGSGSDPEVPVNPRGRHFREGPPPGPSRPSGPSGQGSEPALEPTASLQGSRPAGEYVLYWMKTAVRGHENPALDVARAAAERLRLPLVVASFVLPTCQPYANHRRVKFFLEGLRDAQRELREQGLNLMVHLDGISDVTTLPYSTATVRGAASATATCTSSSLGNLRNSGSGPGGSGTEGARSGSAAAGGSQGKRGSDGALRPEGPGWEALLKTALRAALVVTEDMPVDPDAALLAALVKQLQSKRTSAADTAIPTAVNTGSSREGTGSIAAAPQATATAPAPGVWAVDTACVVPMRLVSQAYDKAYAYRSATEGLRRQRLRSVYGSFAAASTAAASTQSAGPLAQYLSACATAGGAAGDGGAGRTLAAVATGVAASASATAAAAAVMAGAGKAVGQAPCLSWRPVDLQEPGLDICGLVAATPGVNQSVRAVPHMPGGSRAGYARWDSWRRCGGVTRYAASRNDAMQRSGTSRMSAYLHWGMVSSFRIAREAAVSGGSGAGKFLDELVVWRELSYSFCFHKYPLLESLSVLPRWAQDTLAAHASDPRAIKTLQQLEDGTTGDAFWDAAQQQLAAHGELHNNVRMTWGKALLAWCPSPQSALETTLHLNHRYALDGCDPASYGGILWCFGLFDGPKAPARTPITGTLRVRPTGTHARRLNPAAFATLPP